MADENMKVLAKKVYDTLCAELDRREWNYEKNEEDLVTVFDVSGDDIPMRFIIKIDEDRQLIRVFSPLPFKFPEDKRIEGAIVACVATYGMANGSFDYNISDGSVAFRITSSFKDSIIGQSLFQYLISCTCASVDQYNDKMLAVSKGMISVTDFIASEE